MLSHTVEQLSYPLIKSWMLQLYILARSILLNFSDLLSIWLHSVFYYRWFDRYLTLLGLLLRQCDDLVSACSLEWTLWRELSPWKIDSNSFSLIGTCCVIEEAHVCYDSVSSALSFLKSALVICVDKYHLKPFRFWNQVLFKLKSLSTRKQTETRLARDGNGLLLACFI